MIKKVSMMLFASLFIATFASAAVTIRYYNKDSKTHVMKVSMSGSTKEVEFGASKTASVTIQGSSTTCVIETSCGKITVKDGAEIVINNGCITVK